MTVVNPFSVCHKPTGVIWLLKHHDRNNKLQQSVDTCIFVAYWEKRSSSLNQCIYYGISNLPVIKKKKISLFQRDKAPLNENWFHTTGLLTSWVYRLQCLFFFLSVCFSVLLLTGAKGQKLPQNNRVFTCTLFVDNVPH